MSQRDIGQREASMPEQIRLRVTFAAGLQTGDDLSKLGMERLFGQFTGLNMGSQTAELAALALIPVVDYELRHDVGQRQFDRTHGSVRDYECALLDPAGLQQRRRFEQTRRFHHDVRVPDAALPIAGRHHGLAEILAQPLRKGVAALLAARMNADLVEIEQMVEQTHVPVSCPASTDMTENFGILPRQMFGADRRHGAGTHVGNAARIQDRLRRAGARIEQRQDRKLGRKANFVVVYEVANNLDARGVDRRFDRAAQNIEMTVCNARLEMDARFDHRLAPSLTGEARLDGRQDFVVGHLELFDIDAIEIGDMDRRQFRASLPGIRRRPGATIDLARPPKFLCLYITSLVNRSQREWPSRARRWRIPNDEIGRDHRSDGAPSRYEVRLGRLSLLARAHAIAVS